VLRPSDLAPGLLLGENVALGPATEVGGNVVIHDGTVIGDGARIQDGAIVGKPLALGPQSTAAREEPEPVEIGAGATNTSSSMVEKAVM